MEPLRTNSTVLSTSPFLTTAESSVPIGHHVRHGRLATREERARVSRSLSRDALSRLDRDLKALNDNVLRASSNATAALVQQAQDLPDPVRRRHVKSCHSKGQQQSGAMLYEYERPSNQDSPETYDEEDEGEAAVDDDVVLAKPRRCPAALRTSSRTPSTPRIASYAILQTTVDAFEATFTHAAQRLYEDMAYTELLYTLCDEPHKRISIERMVLQPRGVSAATRRRDFVVVVCQKRFKLPDGRQGWVQSVHSVDVPVHHRPTAQDHECVRGLIRRSGVVALESRVHKHTLDVVVTAQLDLRGSASQGAHRAVSKRRCIKVLAAIQDALVTHRVETMAFPGTYRFLEIAFEQKTKQCAICHDRLWRCRVPGWTAARFTCRKCGSSVCGACSHVWEIERTRETTLVGGGRVTTPTRVCNQCVRDPVASSATALDKSALSKSPPSALLLRAPFPQPHQRSEPSDRGTSVFANSHVKPRRESAATDAMRPSQLEFRLGSSDRAPMALSPRSITLAPSVAYDAIDEDAIDDDDDDDDDHDGSRLDVDDLHTSMKTIRLDRRDA